MDACTNPDILRVIYFFLLIIDIVKIIIPIALIILGLVDFSKAVIMSDEKVQKKSISLFMKRLLYAVLVFAVPWIVKVLMITLGNTLGEEGTTNFTDCLENANSQCIEALDSNNQTLIKNYCDSKKEQKYCWQCNSNSSLYNYAVSGNSKSCPAGWHKLDLSEEECGVKRCWQCNNDSSLFGWSIKNPTTYCPAGWHTIDRTEENCK